MRRLIVLMAGLCLLTGFTVGVSGPAQATAAQVAARPTLQPGEYWYYVHAFLQTSGHDDYRCWRPPNTGHLGCSGEYSSATTTAPFDSGLGTALFTTPNDRDWWIELDHPGATLRGAWSGTLDLLNPGSVQNLELLDVTGEGALPGGYAHFRTERTPGVAAGEQGGPLIMGIHNLDGSVPTTGEANEVAIDVGGWVIATDGASTSLPALPDGQYWYYVHLFLDAEDGPLTWACHSDGNGPYCDGTYSAAATTAPYVGGSGTLAMVPAANEQRTYTFYKPGAVLSGLGDRTRQRFDEGSQGEVPLHGVSGQGQLPNGYSFFRLDGDDAIPFGERGGPLRLGYHVTSVSEGDFDATWDLRGWVIASSRPMGATSPESSTTTTTTTTAVTPATLAVLPSAPAAAPAAVAATPRFTG